MVGFRLRKKTLELGAKELVSGTDSSKGLGLGATNQNRNP